MPSNSNPLQAMTDALLKFRRERDWEQFHNAKDQFLSLALEASEVLELAQWRDGEALEQHLTERKQDLADELCDVLGWVLLIANDRQIDLPTSFFDKMKRNEAKYPIELSRGKATKYHELREGASS